jgi:hypothetical protein
VLPVFRGLGVLGRVGRQIDPEPALESPQTVVLPPIRPSSRRRVDTGKVLAGGHGGVAVMAWLSDSTAGAGGQEGSEVPGYATAFSTICQWPDFTLRVPEYHDSFIASM